MPPSIFRSRPPETARAGLRLAHNWRTAATCGVALRSEEGRRYAGSPPTQSPLQTEDKIVVAEYDEKVCLSRTANDRILRTTSLSAAHSSMRSCVALSGHDREAQRRVH